MDLKNLGYDTKDVAQVFYVKDMSTEEATETPKHAVSPAYSPTVARECPHIKCTVGRMQGIRMI